MYILSRIFPHERFALYADRSQLELIENSRYLEKIAVKVPGFGRNTKSSLFKHFLMLMQILCDFYVLCRIKKRNPDIFISLSVTPVTILFAKLLLKKSKNYYICHEVLEYLPYQLHWWKFNYWIKPSLRLWRDNNINIVLGENIKEEALRIIPGISIEAVDNPYIADMDHLEYSELPELIKIGSVGFATEKKGFSLIFPLEKKLCVSDCNNVEFHHIGQIDKNITLPDSTGLVIHGKYAPVGPEEYNKLIGEMTFCIFLYPSDTYRLTVSGPFLDALTYLKPVIAVTNPYFRYMFDKMGDIGYLCNDLEEIAAVIKGICADRNKELYRRQQETIKAGLNYFTLENLENQMRKIFDVNTNENSKPYY
jgi:hypothetical protein